MKKIFAIVVLTMLFSHDGICRNTTQAVSLSDSTIKKKIIEESLAGYSGNCPCPYNTMRNGRACGGRSAYSRPNGASPICYEKQVNKEMIAQWRQDNPNRDITQSNN